MDSWQALLGPLLGVLGAGGVGAVVVALIGRRQAAEVALPEHLSRELERQGALIESQQRRMDVLQLRLDLLSEQNAALLDHIDALEAHIWAKKQPPPPPRPRLRGGDSDA